MDSQGAESDLFDKPLTDEPKILTEIKTQYGFFSQLRCISLVGDEDFWICGSDKIMRLYNIRSELLKTTETKTGNMPEDIAVIKNNELVYTDKKEGTINVLKKTLTDTDSDQLTWMETFRCL